MAITDSDIENASSAELLRFIEKANNEYVQKRANASNNLAGSRRALDELIGPDNPTGPSMSSLTEVQLYTDAQIRDNAALAIRLSFRATEQLARILRDILTLVR